MTDWNAWRKCGICRAAPGSACTAMYTRVLEGEHVGGPVELDRPHGFRKRRTGAVEIR